MQCDKKKIYKLYTIQMEVGSNSHVICSLGGYNYFKEN